MLRNGIKRVTRVPGPCQVTNGTAERCPMRGEESAAANEVPRGTAWWGAASKWYTSLHYYCVGRAVTHVRRPSPFLPGAVVFTPFFAWRTWVGVDVPTCRVDVPLFARASFARACLFFVCFARADRSTDRPIDQQQATTSNNNRQHAKNQQQRATTSNNATAKTTNDQKMPTHMPTHGETRWHDEQTSAACRTCVAAIAVERALF